MNRIKQNWKGILLFAYLIMVAFASVIKVSTVYENSYNSNFGIGHNILREDYLENSGLKKESLVLFNVYTSEQKREGIDKDSVVAYIKRVNDKDIKVGVIQRVDIIIINGQENRSYVIENDEGVEAIYSQNLHGEVIGSSYTLRTIRFTIFNQIAFLVLFITPLFLISGFQTYKLINIEREKKED